MRGTAILVHGGWSNPADWKWVADHLVAAEVEVDPVDLPTHRDPELRRPDDVEEVRKAIRRAEPPVVVAGWSYGTGVVSEAAVIDVPIAGLVYVASSPRPVDPPPEEEPPSGELDLTNFLFGDDGTILLNNDVWLAEGDVITCPDDVLAHLHATPRRPFSVEAGIAPLQGAAWQDLPTIVLLGCDDPLVPPPLQEWALANLDDVRILDSDHFILWRQPEVIATAILELLGR